ncbi:MAG: hypothetical protein OEU86_03070 [Gammaproteobacteria bacterium]|nr:hypothetical protein [Gammaproteobacteria bacterium]
MITDSLLQPVAGLINRGIDMDDQVQDRCDALEGRSMRIHARPLNTPVTLIARDGVIEFETDPNRDVDVEISGSVIELNRLMFIDNEAPIREGHVEVIGNVELADEFRQLLIAAAPDLEEELAEWLGDSAASQITGFISSAKNFLHDFMEDNGQRISERLKDNAGPLPDNSVIQSHMSAVDDLVNDVDRLEARVQRLKEQTSTS